MKESHLETVTELQKVLDRLHEARQRLEGVPDWMRELHEEHSERQGEIEQLEQAIEQTRLERRNAEGSIADLQEKLKRYQEQISSVQNQREYSALLQEIDTVKAEIRGLEEQGFVAMEQRDQAEAAVTEKRAAFQELDERYQAELAKWEAEKPAVEKQVQKLESQRKELEEKLPLPVRSQFYRLFERFDGHAMAEIQTVKRGKGPQTWHCTMCSYRVRPQVVVQIRNQGSILYCDSCKRILYIEESEEAEG